MRSQSLPQKLASPNARSVVATLLQIGSRSTRRSAQRARGKEGKSLMFPLLGWRALMLRSFKEWRYNHKLWIRLKGATIYLTHFFRCWWPLQFQNASGERGTYRQWEWLEEKERRVCGNFESGQEGCTDDQERGKTSLQIKKLNDLINVQVDPRNLPPPPPSDTSHYIECPHCHRRCRKSNYFSNFFSYKCTF